MAIRALLKQTICTLLILLVSCLPVQKKVVRIDRLDYCVIGPSKILKVTYLNIRPAGYGSVVDGQLEIFRTTEQFKTSVKLTKCARKELLDSCEYVTTIKIKNACGYMAEKNSLMTPMMYNHHPPLICPVKKGIMTLSNATYDANLMNFFPLENSYWKLEINMFDLQTDEFLFTICIEGAVIVFKQ